MAIGVLQSTSRKVSIIGAGFVGTSIAYALMLKECADTIVLIDRNREKADAEVFDIKHGMSFVKNINISAGQFSDIADSDLIVVTCGRNRRANETRLDMVADNLAIAETVACEINKHYNKGLVLIVSNPVDIFTYKMTELLSIPKEMVFGSGCILDVSRFSSVLAGYLHVNPACINAGIIGEHGDSQVVLWSKTTVDGRPAEEYCAKIGLPLSAAEKRRIEQQLIDMGTDIIKGKGRTHYGIATCVCHLADMILNGQTVIACVSSVLDGEYGLNDIAISLPCKINRYGVAKLSEENLYIDEFEKLCLSANKIKGVLEHITKREIKELDLSVSR